MGQIRIPKCALAIFLAALLLLGCGSDDAEVAETGSAYPSTGWPVIHHDSRNSDASDTPGPDDVTLVFESVLAGSPIAAGATVGPEGNVYVGTGISLGSSCHLFALDGKTGEQLWCSDRVNDRAIASSPTIDRDGHVYMGDNRAMHSFTRAGKIRWSRPIEGFPISAQFAPDGHLIFITHIGRIYALRRDTGANAMEPFVLLPGVTYTPRPLDYLDCGSGSAEGTCYSANTLSIDQDTGAFYFTLTRPGESTTLLVAMRYVVGSPPRIEHLWENAALEGGSASSPNISADGSRLYVNDQANHLLALNAETGEVIWRYDLGFSPLGTPSSSSADVIIPTGGIGAGLMAIRDAGDHGELLWKRNDLDSRGITPQRGIDRAYAVVSIAGEPIGIRLLVLDTQTGATLDDELVSPVGAATVGTTMSEEGHVYVPGFLGGIWGFAPDQGSAE